MVDQNTLSSFLSAKKILVRATHSAIYCLMANEEEETKVEVNNNAKMYISFVPFCKMLVATPFLHNACRPMSHVLCICAFIKLAIYGPD